MLGNNMDPVGERPASAGGQATQQGGGLLGGLNPIGLALGAAGGIVNTILGKSNADRQWRREKEAMNIQLNNQKDLNAYNQQLQLDTWEKTNYSAQREQMEKAGLNPALLYGMGGAGGGTLGQAGGGAASGGAPTQQQAQIDTSQMLAMGLQLEQQKAQIENIKADTQQKKADAIKTAGVDTDLSRTNIENIIANTKNTETKTGLMEIEKSIAEVNKRITEDTETEQKDFIKNKTLQQIAIAQSAAVRAGIDASTYKEVISEIKANSVGATLRNVLTRSQIGKTNAEKQAIIEGIRQRWIELKQGWTKLSIEEQNNRINEFKADIQAKYPGIMNVAGAAINEVWGWINEQTGTPSYGDKVNNNGGW